MIPFSVARILLIVLSAIYLSTAWAFDSVPNPYTAVVDGAGNEWIHHMVADDAGNLYIAGAYTSAAADGLAKIATSTTTGPGQLAAASGISDAFVAKLDHAGKLLWVARSSGAEEEAATGVGYDRASDKLIVSGYFSGTDVAFGSSIQVSANGNTTGIDGAGLVNLFVAALDPANGNWLSVEPMPLQARVNGATPTTSLGGIEIRTGEYLPAGVNAPLPEKQFMGRALALGPVDVANGTPVYLKGMFNTTALTGPLATGSTQNTGRIQLAAGGFRDITTWDQSGVAGDSGEWSFIVRVNFKLNGLGEITWDWKWNTPVNGHPSAGATDAVTALVVPELDGDTVFLSGYWRGSLRGPDDQDYAAPEGSDNGFVAALNSANGSRLYLATVGGASAIHSLSLDRPDADNTLDQPKLVAVGGVSASGSNPDAGSVELRVINTFGAGASEFIDVPGWPAGIGAHKSARTDRPLVARLDAQTGAWEQSGLLVNDQQEVLLGALHDVEVSRGGAIYASGYSWSNNNFNGGNQSQAFVAQMSSSDTWASGRIQALWHNEGASQTTDSLNDDLDDVLLAAWSFEQPDLGDRTGLPGSKALLQKPLDNLGDTRLHILDPAPGEGVFGQSLSYANSKRRTPSKAGSAYIPADSSPLVNTSGSFTISGWIKVPPDMTNGEGVFFAQDTETRWNTDYSVWGDGNIFRVEAHLGSKFIFTLKDFTVSSTTNMAANNWYQVAVVKDHQTAEIRIYVNGVLEGSVAYNSSLDFASIGTFRIGYYAVPGALLRFFDGDVDEVHLFNVALSDPQVNALYRAVRLSNEPANYMAHELALNSLQTLYTSVATGNIPLVQGTEPKWVAGQPVAGSPSFEQRLDALSAHGAVISAFVPENGDTLTEFLSYKDYLVGDLLNRPAGAIAPATGIDKRLTFPATLDEPANINAGATAFQQTLYPSQSDQEWYAAGPSQGARVLWPTTNDAAVQNPPREGRAIRIHWPTVTEGLREYVYGDPSTGDDIPDVTLNPDDATDVFTSLLWSEDLAGEPTTATPTVATDTLGGKQTLATSANGFAALLYHAQLNPDTSAPRIQAVRAYRWDEKTAGENAVVGREVVPPVDAMTGTTGYPMRPLSKHDTNPLVYDPATRRGQIVPINLDRNPSQIEDDDLRIAWYQEDTSKRDWPFRTVTYTLAWQTDEQVVIASELCSSGVKTNGDPQLPLAGPEGTFTDIQLYVQNDPLLPGFNPNEEHGLLTQVNGDAAACALRVDLAVLTQGACDQDPQTTTPACYTSHPYLIVKAVDPSIDTSESNTHVLQPWVYRVFETKVYDSTNYPDFNLSSGEAGGALFPPFPLNLPGFASPETFGAGTPFWVDVNGQVWARSAGNLTAQYYYPATGGSGDFFIDTDGDGVNDAATVGDIPWLSNLDGSTNGEPLPLTYGVNWPEVVPELEIGDTLTDQRDNGLPAVRNMKTVDVIFDQNDSWDPAIAGAQSTPTRHQDASLRVFDFSVPIGQPPCTDNTYFEGTYCDKPVATNSGDAVVIGTGSLASVLPASIYLENGQWFFPTLPSHLRYRVFFDPTRGTQNQAGDVSGEFTFRGGDFDGETGRPHGEGAGSKLTLINIMNASERDTLKLLDNNDGFTDDVDDNEDSQWDAIVDALYLKTRNPGRLDLDEDGTPDPDILAGFEVDAEATELETQHQQGTGELALTAAFADQEGYITIAENNVIDGSGDPVNVHVMKIIEPRARGALRVLRNADNKLDERLVVRHDLDFGGRDGMTFEWWWRPDNGAGIPPVNLSNGCAEPGPGTNGCPTPADGWLRLGQSADNSYTLRAGLEILADGWVLARYKGLPTLADPNGEEWVGYAGQQGIQPTETRPVATAGWVKRVLEGINAFEQRYDDLNQNAPVAYSSLLIQAGRPYAGDVALNGDDGNLNQVGLIELYQTVLNRAGALSINAVNPITNQEAVNKQLLLAANRLAEFSMILGDEAYSDAQDPTVGVIDAGGSPAYLSPNQFAFQNQVPTLLDEELALLRGRTFAGPSPDPYPVYNRLPWNFSSGDGEPVYVQVYGVTDQADPLGAVDDAQRSFPQGHGDALGYYLDATKQYYRLALHPNYDWKPLAETTTIAGVAVEVDYADEQTFAQAASRKAHTAARILDLTYRQNYTHDPSGQWTGYPDTDPNRRWGVDGWARRGAQGAYLDYALANALLKNEDTVNTGLQKIDRQTVTEVDEIASAFGEIESLMNLADSGRNPLGLSADAVPFDISPTELDLGETHFDQVYKRAVKASVNALQVFNYANDLTQAIRTEQLNQGDLQAQVDAREQEYKHRLIELFGYPYAGDKGPNATYPPDYTGADLYHYMYLDATTIDGDDAQGLLPPAQIDTLTFTPSFSPEAHLDATANTEAARIDFLPRDVVNPGASSGYEHWFDVDPDATIDIPYPYATAGDYAYTAPANWGKRRAPGEIQLALLEMLRLQARLKAAFAKQQAVVEEALAKLEVLEAKYAVAAHSVEVRNTIFDTYASLQSTLITMRQVKEAFSQSGEMIYRIKSDLGGCLGANDLTVGFSTSIPNVAKCVQTSSSAAFIAARLARSTQLSLAQIPVEIGASLSQFAGSLAFQNLSVPAEAAILLKDIETELRKELELRYQIAEIGQELEIAAGKYEALVAQGLRVLEERVTFRRDIARITTDARYEDYVYRVFRNDALQKYRASFDLAARYTYLAAKAFDYETGLLSTDPANGTFLDSILKQRSLGQFTVSTSDIGNSTPLANVNGLSDPLAKMKQAYDALAANFNNVYDQNVRFSLREEMLRIPAGADYDEAWQQSLTDAVVPNLWDIPEFRQYAVAPRNESTGPLPGLVLRFGTQINSGKNLFGWPLGPGDASYSTTYSSTKFRRVGINLLDYDGNALLASTPYVYLLPAGVDVLRSPTETDRIRQYAVVEQAIPVPVDLLNGGGYDQAGWIPSEHGIPTADSWDAVRKHPQLQAGWGAGSGQLQPLGSTRLVGRSVWNTEWLLVIPGIALLADEQEGLRRLISGSANGSVDGISDIELFFESFSVQ